jgi:hypothetical protein
MFLPGLKLIPCTALLVKGLFFLQSQWRSRNAKTENNYEEKKNKYRLLFFADSLFV